jgi:hypothetical protein
VVTLAGIVNDESEIAYQKALPPIDVRVFGSVSEVRFGRLSKALSGIVVMPEPMVTEVIPVEPKKASLPIDVTLSGITNAPLKLVPLKASSPIDTTVFEIVRLVTLAFLRALFAIPVTPVGRPTDPVHDVLPVTTVAEIVKEPLVPQF